ncbi:MAG TPA: class I SAM-dependent methyltransferase [Planctomycetota bacterium]|jgi:SAM-dependent methyltransferase
MATIHYQCPSCKTALSPERKCGACGVSFPHRSVGGTEITDFLLATRPAGECRCPVDQASERCNVFLDQLAPVPAEPFAEHYKSRILQPLRASRDQVILDIGCREAPIGHLLAKDNCVVGVDRCPQKMLVSTPNALDKGYKELWIADAAALPVADAQADVIIATDLLEHVVTPEILLKEFHRALKPGGRILISVPNLVSYNNRLSILLGSGVGMELHLVLKGRCPVNPISGARYPEQTQHLRFFTLKSLLRTVEACGFRAERAWGYDPVLSRIPFGDRLLRNFCLLSVVLAVKS